VHVRTHATVQSASISEITSDFCTQLHCWPLYTMVYGSLARRESWSTSTPRSLKFKIVPYFLPAPPLSRALCSTTYYEEGSGEPHSLRSSPPSKSIRARGGFADSGYRKFQQIDRRSSYSKGIKNQLCQKSSRQSLTTVLPLFLLSRFFA